MSALLGHVPHGPDAAAARHVASLLCLLALALSPGAASAWLEGGHLQAADVAWERLSPAKREAAVALLRQHPRFDEDFAPAMPAWPEEVRAENEARWIFTRAGTWPDIARGFEGEDRLAYHHADWHGIAYPYFLADAASQTLRAEVKARLKRAWQREPGRPPQNAVQALHQSVAQFADAQLTAPARALSLCWLLHIGANVHQPLYAISLYSDRVFPQGDGGGGRIPVAGRENLRRVWDAAPGEEVQLEQVRERVDAMMKRRDLRRAGKRAADVTEFDGWVSESFRLAKKQVYDDAVLAPVLALERGGDGPLQVTLSPAYLEKAEEISRVRIVEAGYRLARLLENLEGL